MNTDHATHKIGDLVRISDDYATAATRGRIFRVTKFLKVNIVAEPVEGGRSIKGNPDLFVAVSESETAKVTTIPFTPLLYVGQVVQVAGGSGWREPKDRFFVVIREGNDGKVKIVRLGGDDGRYWPGVPKTWLKVVDVAVIIREQGE